LSDPSCSFSLSPEAVGLPPVVVTDVEVVVAGAGAGTTTVRAAGAVPVAAEGGGVALRWITTVRCFTIGFRGFGVARPGAAATVEAEDVPIPQWKVTAAAPAMKDAAKPPAVSPADRLFIARSFAPRGSATVKLEKRGARAREAMVIGEPKIKRVRTTHEPTDLARA
jgi:hypothetical protein